MLKFLRWLLGYQRTELTLFQESIAANIRTTSNYQTMSGPVLRDHDLSA